MVRLPALKSPFNSKGVHQGGVEEVLDGYLDQVCDEEGVQFCIGGGEATGDDVQ